jgi:hypothetical protein
MLEAPRPAAVERPSRLTLLASVLAASLLAAGAVAAAPPTPAADPGPIDAASLEKAVGAPALDPARAVTVNHLALNAGPAKVELGAGILIPAAPLGGRTIELVFVGAGRATLDPPDAVEAGQLDLFTAHSRLDESLTAAVLVLGMDNAAAALLRRPAAVPSPPQLAAAQDLFAEWKKRERRVMGVEGHILGRAAGDSSLAGYFAALCRGVKLGDFLYVFDPQAQEQVTLGRFVPIDPSAKEKKQLLKELARQQRRGRLMGTDLDQLGTWDTWVSASPRDPQGRPQAGAAAFEPRLYELDTALVDHDLRLTGKARIELVPILKGARTVKLRLQRDLAVSRVSLDPPAAASPSLVFHRDGSNLTVVLPRAFGEGEVLGLTVEYAGSVIEKVEGTGTYQLLDTVDWYPHAGEIDRARYSATFHWPRNLTLLASGHHVAGGDSPDGGHWEKRALDQPSLAFSFEIGKFRLQTAQAGHVRITIGFDAALSAHLASDIRDQMLKTVGDALTYYEGVFGPYPLDEMAVATAPRAFSQGTQGLVTLSDLAILDLREYGLEFFAAVYGMPDRRAVIAHEVAHQWWGDSVGWASYRDQWISEALASYCASLFTAKAGLDHQIVGMTARWQQSLTETTADGRDVESIGPVVLGSRLASSLSSNAYQAIVYDKGAVVLKTLEATLGAGEFLRALAQVYKQNVNQTLSTQDLVNQLGVLTSTDLSAFADQFIYGTGLRTIFYSYHFQPQAGGAFQVAGTTREETPRHYRYRVVRTAGGAFDVQREAIAEQSAAAVRLAVPVEIDFVDPGRPPAKKGAPNATMNGRFWIHGPRNEFSIEVHGEPKTFVLNRRGEVFARFVDEERHPRRSLLVAARIAADQDRGDEAETLLAKALADDGRNEADPVFNSPGMGADHGLAQRRLTVEIQLSRARLFLQRGRDAAAKEALDAAGGAAGYGFGGDRDLLLSWLDVRGGRFDSAYRRLHDSDLDTAESTLLLAIAARATGHREELEAALKAARRKGADASALQDSSIARTGSR